VVEATALLQELLEVGLGEPAGGVHDTLLEGTAALDLVDLLLERHAPEQVADPLLDRTRGILVWRARLLGGGADGQQQKGGKGRDAHARGPPATGTEARRLAEGAGGS